MDHSTCLKQLSDKGASPHLVSLVAAFLCERSMVVRVDNEFSGELPVNGGAPQGSILGPYLFCITSELLSKSRRGGGDGGEAVGAGAGRGGGEEEDDGLPSEDSTADLYPETDSSDGDWASGRAFPHFTRHQNPLDDTVRSIRYTTADMNRSLGDPDVPPPPPITKVYIDDFNIVESIPVRNSITHYTQRRPKSIVQAAQSQDLLEDISENAEEINMKVNPLKTQLLCISGDRATDVVSYIRLGDTEINSGVELKILGFIFGDRPDVSAQIDYLCGKFRKRLWSLRKVKSTGLCREDCLSFYTTYMRPVIEYTKATYHSMLNVSQRLVIEGLQKRVLKIVLGLGVHYQDALAASGLDTLTDRRKKSFKKLALKCSNDYRFQGTWFPLNGENGHDLRTGKIYREFFARSERLKNSPIFAMRRLLNCMEDKQS